MPDHIVYISQIIENFTFLCNRKLFVVQQNNKNKRINVLLYILECHSFKNIQLFEYNKNITKKNIENIENKENKENIENIENIENKENIENIENIQNIQNIPFSACYEKSKHLL